MIALSLGRCKPFLTMPALRVLWVNRTGPGKLCRSSHVHNAPKATAGRQNVARRHGPGAEVNVRQPQLIASLSTARVP